jgi:hypothetical protein
MSIAVAYWLLGLGSSFTKYEKVEFSTAYVTGTGTGVTGTIINGTVADGVITASTTVTSGLAGAVTGSVNGTGYIRGNVTGSTLTGTVTNGITGNITAGTVTDQSSAYVITLNFKNTGSAAAKVDTAVTLYNGKPDTYYTGTTTGFNWTWTPATGMSMDPGASASATITLPTTFANGVTGFTSGMTLEMMLHTAGGKDYPKVITLP